MLCLLEGRKKILIQLLARCGDLVAAPLKEGGLPFKETVHAHAVLKERKTWKDFFLAKPYTHGSLTVFKQSLFLTDSPQDKLRNLSLAVFHMLVYQVNGWKMGKKKPRSTELHSLFYQCSYIVLKQTRKQTESFGAFLKWKAVLSWGTSLNCEQNRGGKKAEDFQRADGEFCQRQEAQVTPDFCVKQITVASHRHDTLEWADTILPNLTLDFVCFICLHWSPSSYLRALTAVEAMNLLCKGGIKVSCGDAQNHCTPGVCVWLLCSSKSWNSSNHEVGWGSFNAIGVLIA